MRPRSARWDVRIIASHRISLQVSALLAGVPVPGADNLRVAKGRVTLDRRAAVRGRLQIDLAEPLLVPNGPGDPLSPFGFELAITRGITYADGTTERIPIGVFPIQSSNANDLELTSVDALDRAQLVRDARLEDDFSIAAGTNYADAIRSLIATGVPATQFAFATTPYTTPALVFPVESDRWAKAVDMARSIGCELFFNGDGVCVLQPEPTATGTPVLTLAEGAGSVLIDAGLKLDRATAYNRVVVSSTSTTAGSAFRAVATDSDPNSPTAYAGPFGRKPRFFASPLIASQAQAAAAAAGILATSRGVAKSITFDMVPNPTVEPGDLVRIARSSLGIDELHVTDRLSIPLTADETMTGETRQVASL